MIKHSFQSKLKNKKTKLLIVRVSEEFSQEFTDIFARLGDDSRKNLF